MQLGRRRGNRLDQIARRFRAHGCTDEEIARVETDQGLVLSQSYRSFLRAMGRDGGGLFDGGFVTYPYVLGFRDDAINLLEDASSAHPLPDDAIIIAFHDQGVGFMYIRSSLGDDAPVEVQYESGRPTVAHDSILDWVRAAVESRPSRREREWLSRKLMRGFGRPICPTCGVDWSHRSEVQVLPRADRINVMRDVECHKCASRWLWSWYTGLVPDLGGRSVLY